MNMTRRGFLKALAASVAIAAIPAIVPTGSEALAAIINPQQKYIDALALYDKVIEVNAIMPRDHGLITEAWDNLFVHIHANFAAPEMTPENVKHVKEILKQQDQPLDTQLRKIPPVIVDAVWPIAAAKSLLCDHRVALNHKKCQSFKVFHDRYGPLILDS